MSVPDKAERFEFLSFPGILMFFRHQCFERSGMYVCKIHHNLKSKHENDIKLWELEYRDT